MKSRKCKVNKHREQASANGMIMNDERLKGMIMNDKRLCAGMVLLGQSFIGSTYYIQTL